MSPSVRESDQLMLRQTAKTHLDVQVGDVVVVEIPKTFQELLDAGADLQRRNTHTPIVSRLMLM